jgi:hypothetical protein
MLHPNTASNRAAVDAGGAEVGAALRGGCGCGAVRYEISEPLTGAAYCHCTRCQRRSGTAASASGRVARGSFRVVSGEAQLRAWRPDGGWEKWFCGTCGSALFSRSPNDPDRLAVRLGSFDGDPGIRPALHQFVAYAAQWEALPDDGLPRYPETRPRPHAHTAQEDVRGRAGRQPTRS